MSDLTLAELDRDGALLEPLAALQGSSRAEFLSRAALGGGALLGALLAAGAAEAKPSHKQDVAILNFALSLEYLQDSFYTEVERLGGFRGPLGEQARTVAAHERAHVVALREVLGGKAVKRGSYDFRGATRAVTPSAARRWPSRNWRSPPTRGRRRGSRTRDSSSPRSASTRSRRATPRGSGGWRARRRPRTRSTSRARRRARWGWWRRPSSSSRRGAGDRRASPADRGAAHPGRDPGRGGAGAATDRTRGSRRRHGRRCRTWAGTLAGVQGGRPDPSGLGAVRVAVGEGPGRHGCAGGAAPGRRRGRTPGGAHAGRDH